MGDRKWNIIGKGKTGWHADTVNISSSSYDRSDNQLNKYASEAEDGALVYDASKAEMGLFTSFVLSGPVVNCELAPGQVDVFSNKDRESAQEMLPLMSGGFDTMVMLENLQSKTGKRFIYGSFDRVAPDVYVSLLRKFIPNVRFGAVKNGTVAWE